jgi:hypothetical protein
VIKKTTSGGIRKMKELAQDMAIYKTLQNQHTKNGLGFSNYLAAISEAHPSGVWLTSTNIKKRNNSVTLSGKAHYPENIMQLVDNLNHNPIFSDSPFFLAKIEKTRGQIPINDKTQTGTIYEFTLQTREATETKT